MSLKIEDDNVFLKYNEIWNKIKKKLYIRFHSQPIYDKKYIKTKVKTFNTERNHYSCIAAIDIDSVMKIDKEKLSSSLSRTM